MGGSGLLPFTATTASSCPHLGSRWPLGSGGAHALNTLTIRFGTGRDRAIVAHEVAHLVEYQEGKLLGLANPWTERPAHGPHWLGWFVELLIAAELVPLPTVLRSADFYRLPIAPKSDVVRQGMTRLRIKPAA